MEEAILFRHWTFEHQFPGEAKPRSWKLERPKPSVKAAYGLHLERLTLSGITRHRDVMDEFTFKVALREWTNGFTDGAYGWRSERFDESLTDDANRRELAWAWFQQAEAGMAPKEQITFAQFRDLWDARRADVSGLLKEMLTEKNPTRPRPEETARD